MTTQIATQKTSDIRALIASDAYKKQFAAALPKHLSPDRFIRVALTAVTRQPDLLKCDQASFMLALLNLSALGLEPDGRRAHLIPFNNGQAGIKQVQLIIDYKGLAELVRRSGDVSDMHADVVCENDEFSYIYGTGSHLKHKPILRNRGDVIGAYSYVRLKDGADSFEVMGLEEINKIRDSSQGYKAAIKYKKGHPWIEHFSEMAKKTVFRRHTKWLPLSPEMRDAVEKDDEELQEINVTPDLDRPSPKKQGSKAEQIMRDSDDMPLEAQAQTDELEAHNAEPPNPEPKPEPKPDAMPQRPAG